MSLYDPQNLVLKVMQSIGLEQGETWLWPFLECFPGGAAEALAGIREPMAVGETAQLINFFDGLNHLPMASGEDYILKAIWISFTEPMYWEVLQPFGGLMIHSCIATFPMNSQTFYMFLPLGWVRSFVEDINVAGNTIIRLTNRGNQAAIGKCWVIGKKKRGTYRTWL